MKKIMMLGGNYFQMTAIKAAKKCGYYVITVDYLPSNPGHIYADEYYNISTLDKEAVLALAIEKSIDGIVSYASDVSASTAAYVAEKMGLFTNPLKSVEIMTNKNLFRDLLDEMGYACPKHRAFKVEKYKEAKQFACNIGYPVVIKPIDSSGSKGVFVVNNENKFDSFWKKSVDYARSGVLCVEKFVTRSGYQIDGDIFVTDGKIAFWGICNQHHDERIAPFTPIGLSYPPVQDRGIQQKAENMVEKLIEKLGIIGGGFNLEYQYDEYENIYIMELAPRNGGNLIPDILSLSTGIDMAELTVRMAVDDELPNISPPSKVKCFASYIWHSTENGKFRSLEVDEIIKNKLVRSDMLIKDGEMVEKFENGGHGIGAAIMEFSNQEEMLDIMDNMDKHFSLQLYSN